MKLQRPLIVLATLTLLAATDAHLAPAAPEPPPLSHAAASVDALVDRLLQALSTNDEAALHQLRVNEDEYLGIIAPGTVESGQPLRVLDETGKKLFWPMLDTKSRDFARVMMAEHGGKKLTRKEVRFARGSHTYAGYTAHGQTRVLVTDEAGVESVVRSGTIAQIGDQYKFIGLNWDD